MRSPLSRNAIEQGLHVLYEIAYFQASIFSRATNAIFFGGSMHQTLSSRTYVEARASDKWFDIETRVNFIFWVLTLGRQEDHCKKAWQSEVTRALKTLQRNEEL